MKRVYVAGPYRAPDVLGMLRNIREGINVAVLLMKTGDAPFCPWLDHQYGLQAEIPLETYQKTSMAWLEVSEAVVLVHGWQQSQGTLAEIRRARELGIPVYDGVEAYHRNETFQTVSGVVGGPWWRGMTDINLDRVRIVRNAIHREWQKLNKAREPYQGPKGVGAVDDVFKWRMGGMSMALEALYQEFPELERLSPDQKPCCPFCGAEPEELAQHMMAHAARGDRLQTLPQEPR